jgi:hypothetical protein
MKSKKRFQKRAPFPREGCAGEFDWNATDGSIVLREQAETAIYFNEYGGLVIRQRSWPNDDVYVVITESNIGRFLDELTDICGIPSAGRR